MKRMRMKRAVKMKSWVLQLIMSTKLFMISAKISAPILAFPMAIFGFLFMQCSHS